MGNYADLARRAFADVQAVADDKAAIAQLVASIIDQRSDVAERISAIASRHEFDSCRRAELENALGQLVEHETRADGMSSLVAIGFENASPMARGVAMLVLLESADESSPLADPRVRSVALERLGHHLGIPDRGLPFTEDMVMSWLCSVDAMRKSAELLQRIDDEM